MPDRIEFEDEQRGDRLATELDLYSELLRSQVSDEWLERNNLGTGNYADPEMWQQVESYGLALYGEASYARRLFERAVSDAKQAVALTGFSWMPEEGQPISIDGWADLEEREQHRLDRRRWLERERERKWAELPQEAKLAAIQDRHYGGFSSGTFESAFHRMIAMRHETSRSRGGTLMGYITGAVQQLFSDTPSEQTQDALTNGHGGGKP